jgi:hypothetical protein
MFSLLEGKKRESVIVARKEEFPHGTIHDAEGGGRQPYLLL